MKKFIYQILFLLGMSGCAMGVGVPQPDGSKPVHIHFHGDERFLPAERHDIQLAAGEWLDATNGLAQAVIDWDMKNSDGRCSYEPCLFRHQPEDSEVVIEDADAGCPKDFGCVLGWVSNLAARKILGETQDMHLIPARDGADLKQVAAHEFGHAFGLAHVPQSQWALMYPSMNHNQKKCITQADISEFCRVNTCGTHKMEPCD